MGPATHGLLDSVDTPHHTLYAQDGVEEFAAVLEKAEKDLAEQRAPFVLVERGAIGKAAAANSPHTEGLPAAEAHPPRHLCRSAGSRRRHHRLHRP